LESIPKIRKLYDEFANLARLPNTERIYVAFSGGGDSTALLHVASDYYRQREVELIALHVNHGLQSQSEEWARHCISFAAKLGVDCRVLEESGGSEIPISNIEKWARDLRYRLISEVVEEGDEVLFAHHADDQIETVLYRIVQGAGPFGLRGMPERRPLGKGFLWRPFLKLDREMISEHCRAHALLTISDPSNQSTRFARNRIRSEFLPAAERVHEGARSGLLRLAMIQKEISSLIDDLTHQVLEDGACPPGCILVTSLEKCPPSLISFVLMRAIKNAGLEPPGNRHLRQMKDQLMLAGQSKNPVVRWSDSEARRYRDKIYFLKIEELDIPSSPIELRPGKNIAIPRGTVALSEGVLGSVGINPEIFKIASVSIRFRKGGEMCRPVGRKGARPLKKLFQEWGIPPWDRAITPILYADDNIVAVGNYCLCEGFLASKKQVPLKISWIRE
jgi:tRNA(Ile)-lysidine synthase